MKIHTRTVTFQPTRPNKKRIRHWLRGLKGCPGAQTRLMNDALDAFFAARSQANPDLA